MLGSQALIATVVEALHLRDRQLQSAVARAYFRGAVVRGSSREHTLRAFGDKLVEFAVGVHPPFVSRPWSKRFDTAAVVEAAAELWDWRLRTFGERAAVIELSVRLAGAALLWIGSSTAICEYLAKLETTSFQDWLPSNARLSNSDL